MIDRFAPPISVTYLPCAREVQILELDVARGWCLSEMRSYKWEWCSWLGPGILSARHKMQKELCFALSGALQSSPYGIAKGIVRSACKYCARRSQKLSQNLAANSLLSGLRAMDDALWGRQNPGTQASRSERKLLKAAINPPGGLGHAPDLLDGAISVGVVLEIDLDLVVLRGARTGRRDDAHAGEIALRDEDLDDGGGEARVGM